MIKLFIQEPMKNIILTVLTLMLFAGQLRTAHGNSHNSNMTEELSALANTDYKQLSHLLSPDGLHALMQTKSKIKKECMGGEYDGEPKCPWDVLVLYDTKSGTPKSVLEVNSYISGVQWFPDNKRVLYSKREGINNYQTTIVKDIETAEEEVPGYSGRINIIKSCTDHYESLEGYILIEKSSYYVFGGRYWWYEIIDTEGNTKGRLPGESSTEAPSRAAADSICTYMDILERPPS